MSEVLEDARRALRSEGMAAHPIKTRAAYLRGYGFAPEVVVDVGVGGGTTWLYRCFPQARFVLVDPQASCEAEIATSGVPANFDFHAVALGEAPGTARLTVPRNRKGRQEDMASLRIRTDPMADNFTGGEMHDVPVARLDDLMRACPGRVGLKIDTEGYEAEVLRGGAETLSRCEFVILELSVTPRFDGVAPPSEVVALLAAAGLEMRDVLTVAGGPGRRARPRYMDVLFARWGT
ncbi:FkbM family methyltransferase [Sulfitobacter sp. D35]|uniref:FkbM family methyltransferase n=1 Tax=Sulfitobacter sp. D35 TaxID=3083252 RepID=UPI00296E2844|nr:FkbM family methyltransferase [Sulfitobacter sp. D35]MDW4499074.1 FkbM family methyltransferase [Sulfitobacter sp. D35]